MSYLRSPITTPATLPRAAQLTSSSSSRLEALLELRDEAIYLGLEELTRLCSDELAARCRARTTSYSSSHAHSHSQSSIRTMGRRGSSGSIAPPATHPMPTASPMETSDETSPPAGDAASDASSGSTGSSVESLRDPTMTATTARPMPARSPPRASSHGSLVALYDRSPVVATHPRRPAAAIPSAPRSAPDIGALLRARAAAAGSSAGSQPGTSPEPAFTPGLQKRLATRTHTGVGKFNSVKTRPPAEWI